MGVSGALSWSRDNLLERINILRPVDWTNRLKTTGGATLILYSLKQICEEKSKPREKQRTVGVTNPETRDQDSRLQKKRVNTDFKKHRFATNKKPRGCC